MDSITTMSATLELTDLYDMTFVTELAVAPGGDRVAFVVDEFDRAAERRWRSLYVVPTDGSRDPHRLTHVGEAGTPSWSPDGSRLAFVAARDPDTELRVASGGDGDEEDGDDEPKSQVWLFDLELGGEPRQVTTAADFREGVSEFDWAPDGDRLVVAARDPTEDQRAELERRREENGPVVTERLQHKFDGHGWLDEVRTYLFVVDVETREATRLDDAYGGNAPAEYVSGVQPSWSPAGDRIAFVSNRTENPDDSHVMDVYTIAPDGTDLTKHTESDVTASALRWSPDGDRLAFVKEDPGNWYIPTELFVLSLDDGSYGSVSGELDRPVMGAPGLGWTDDGTVVGPVGDEGRTRLVRFHADGSPPERVLDAQGEFRTIGLCDVDGDIVGLTFSDPAEGTDVYVVNANDLDDGEPRRLSAVNASMLDDHAVPQCRRVTYENADGEEIEAIVYLPDDFDTDEPDPLPLITAIHGGPIWYDSPSFEFDHWFWTNRGYAVLRPNYRGSSSYGRAFSESIAGEWGPRETDDVASGVDALVERGWADADRVFTTGFSYGGITTAWLISRTDKFAAAAAEHGVYDFYSAFGTDDSHNWAEMEVGLPWENPDSYHEMSSINEVDEIDTPVLVTAGGNDWRCPQSQAEQFYVSVRKRGVPARLVVYPSEHHRRLYDVEHPDLVIHRLEQLTEWFERHDPAMETEGAA